MKIAKKKSVFDPNSNGHGIIVTDMKERYMHTYIYIDILHGQNCMYLLCCCICIVSSGNQVVHNLILNRNAVTPLGSSPPLALIYDYQFRR